MTKARPAPLRVRLLAEGTRVFVVGASPRMSGVITQIRPETNLKTYVVICDDGSRIFASDHEIVRVIETAPPAPLPEPLKD